MTFTGTTNLTNRGLICTQIFAVKDGIGVRPLGLGFQRLGLMAHPSWSADCLGIDPTLWHDLPTGVTLGPPSWSTLIGRSPSRTCLELSEVKKQDASSRRGTKESSQGRRPVYRGRRRARLFYQSRERGRQATWLEYFSRKNAVRRRMINGVMLQFNCASDVLGLRLISNFFLVSDRALRGHILREYWCLGERKLLSMSWIHFRSGSQSFIYYHSDNFGRNIGGRDASPTRDPSGIHGVQHPALCPTQLGSASSELYFRNARCADGRRASGLALERYVVLLPTCVF